MTEAPSNRFHVQIFTEVQEIVKQACNNIDQDYDGFQLRKSSVWTARKQWPAEDKS
jgi:hypothetical protein